MQNSCKLLFRVGWAILASIIIPVANATGIIERYSEYTEHHYNMQGMWQYQLKAKEYLQRIPTNLGLPQLLTLKHLQRDAFRIHQGGLETSKMTLTFREGRFSNGQLEMQDVRGISSNTIFSAPFASFDPKLGRFIAQHVFMHSEQGKVLGHHRTYELILY